MNYYPGDVIQVIHRDSGMQFPECKVYLQDETDHVIYLMGATWHVKSDEEFDSLYPQFVLKVIKKVQVGEDEDAT